MNIEELINKAKTEKQKELNLSGLGLTEFPKQIFQLLDLETLKIMNNCITQIPYEIKKLKKLKNLYLYQNQIKDIPKDLLIEMPYLECFDLAENPINYYDVVDFHEKYNKQKGYRECLKVIERTKKSNRNFFSYFDSIRSFPTEIFELTEIKSLSFHGKYITEIPKGLGKLKNLKILDLSGNRLTSIPEDIIDIPNLEEVILDSNEFVIFPDKILKLPNIRNFHISNNKLTTFNKEVFYHPTLRNFVALANPFKDFDANLFNYDFKTLKQQFKR